MIRTILRWIRMNFYIIRTKYFQHQIPIKKGIYIVLPSKKSRQAAGIFN